MPAKTAYYLVRILQRFSLLFLGLSTVILWIAVISISVTSTTGATIRSGLNGLADTAVNRLTWSATGWAVTAAVLTIVLALFPSVRRNEKRLLVDSAVIIIFCFGAVALCQFLVHQFLNRLYY